MKKTLFMLACLTTSVAACVPVQSQTQQSVATANTEKMTSADVIALAGLGLADDIIIAKIRAAKVTEFDTTVRGLAALKAAKVSDEVIRVMLDPPKPQVGDPSAPSSATVVTADYPLKAHVVSLVHPKDGPIPGPPLRCSPPRLGETMIQIGNTLYTAECRQKGIEVGQDYPAKLYEKNIIVFLDGKAISFRVRGKQEAVKP